MDLKNNCYRMGEFILFPYFSGGRYYCLFIYFSGGRYFFSYIFQVEDIISQMTCLILDLRQ